jgi:predicted O-methyltransferase YrrM
MTFGICLMIKDENEYLEEWLNYHRSIGISRFFIYDNNSKIPISETVKDQDDVTVILWEDDKPFSQHKAYNHCCKNYKDEVDKVFFIDTDEFIEFSDEFKSLEEVFSFLEKEYGSFDSLILYWRLYGKSKPYFETRQLFKNYTDLIDSFDFIRYVSNKQVKSVLNIKKHYTFVDAHIAFCFKDIYIDELGNNVKDNLDIKKRNHSSKYIWIRHNWSRSLEEFKKKIERGTGDHLDHNIKIEDFYKYNDNMELKTSMRDNNSVNGLVELCNDLKSHFGDKEITIVEIGSYMGESAEIFARELPNAKVICIDPWEGNYDNADWASSSDFNDVEKQFNLRMEMYPNIEKMKGYSTDFGFPFDFIYIDGCHLYECVKNDINHWKPFVKEGGVIGGHDHHPNWNDVIKAINETLGTPDKIYGDSSWIKKIN